MGKETVSALPAIDRPMAYRWLAGLYSNELTPEMLENYAGTEGQVALNALAAEPCFAPVIGTIRKLTEQPDQFQSAALDLATHFAYLFLGVGGRYSAPPYQSAYSDKSGMLFQQSTTEMDAVLRELDLSVVSELKEPPDHIAIQLSVMAQLADKSVSANLEDGVAGAELIEQQMNFIDRHLLNWTPAFRDDCILNDKGDFYANLARATVQYLARDRAWLAAIESGD
ncbi:molecular chaperone TorD [Sedimenticola thiotaurini]|uniref:Molecular chaperone TorD n=1 Tax=Sedimenticola thiotaurini TaxID=1543721 RepID=A0A0F7JZI4_9GAMM|nr:molecular chaperone TorD [Sedimenticola thiotaurini]AKH20749.1 hypothetical protein AAY24_10750 [Sedimenticola thiotaurini]